MRTETDTDTDTDMDTDADTCTVTDTAQPSLPRAAACDPACATACACDCAAPSPPPPPMPRPLPPGGWLTEAETGWFDETARSARAGDPAAREALWIVLEPRFNRWARRAHYRWGGARDPRRDGHPWTLPDLEQEGFPLLLGILASWTGDAGFFAYVLWAAPRRIAAACRGMRSRLPAASPAGLSPYLVDESAAAAEAQALLAALADGLGGVDGALVLACIGEGRSLEASARRLGLGRRAAQRRWESIRARLRAELSPGGG